MHLSSLTLKGFKSFASATTLRLEPGITAVVGPNGSGKSNVVDAIAWVLGEQGAKSLRGGKMEDVIFAGTAGRAALGRAEVTLTIDNADGALPIDYAEVAITRRMYRSGESEYEINGDKVRLLDVQELLSDSGIGREMHVIVGQGQLDAVLSGRPEDRRGFIEEAAGVLKHRKRKEKALRKLTAMQANLDRLADLTTELRRQLKPLGRQAEVARRAAGIQADLRDARLRLLADDLVALRTALDADVADETAAREQRARVEAELAAASGAAGRAGGGAGRRRPGADRRPGHLVPALDAGGAVPQHRAAGRRAAPAPVGRGHRARRPGPRRPRRGGRPGRGRRGRAGRAARRRAGPADRRHRGPHRPGRRPGGRRAGAGDRGPRAGRPPRGPGPAVRPGRRGAVAHRGGRGRGRAGHPGGPGGADPGRRRRRAAGRGAAQDDRVGRPRGRVDRAPGAGARGGPGGPGRGRRAR